MKIADDKDQVPADAIEALARRLLPEIRSYFESEEGKAAFTKWKSQQTADALSVPAEKNRQANRAQAGGSNLARLSYCFLFPLVK